MKTRMFVIIFTIANLGLFLYGLLALTMPGILYDSFSRYVYQFPENAKPAINYLLALYRLLGFFNLLSGATNLFLLWRLRLTAQAWIARLVVFLSLLAYLGPIVFDNTVGHVGVFEFVELILFGAMLVMGGIGLRKSGWVA